MDKSKLKSSLASGKGKKILPIVMFLIVAVGGYAILSGGKEELPPEAPPMSAQQAMAAARAKLASEGKAVPLAPASAASVAQTSVPASASSVESVVAAATVPAPAASVSLADVAIASSAPARVSAPVNPSPVVVASAASSPSVPEVVVKPATATIASATEPAVATAPPSAIDFTPGWRRNDVLASLEWQARVLELKAKIASLQRQVDGTDVASGAAPATPAVVMPPPATLHSENQLVSSLEIPLQAPTPRGSQLESVMMVGGKYQAVVSAHGASLAVGEGARLSDGWVVQGIDATSVRLVRGREHKTLRIGG